MHSVFVAVELYVSVKYVKILRPHSAFRVNLRYRLNADYTYQFLKEIVFRLVCTLFTRYIKRCKDTKEFWFSHSLL